MPRRIYIDSRFCLAGGTASNFQISLPSAQELPGETSAVITQVHLPNVFPTIRLGLNDQFYWKEQLSGQAAIEKVSAVTPGNYTAPAMATELARLMNAGTNFTSGSAGGVTTPPFAWSFSASDGVLSVTNTVVYNAASPPVQQNVGSLFSIPTRGELESLTSWGGSAITSSTLRDCAEQIGRIGGVSTSTGVGTAVKFTEHFDSSSVKSIYLCSPDVGGTHSAIGPRHERDILAKIPIGTVAFGQHGFFENWSGFDSFRCDHMTLSTLSFQLRDTFGNEVDMAGRHISFSLLFLHSDLI
jgi:hypothetical protein